MKTFLISVLLLYSSSIRAQTQERAVAVGDAQTFYLNSATHLGGNSRQVLVYYLPPNTVRWFYSFSASRNKADVERVHQTFDLLGKVSYAFDRSGTTAGILSQVGKPPGADYCDAILLADERSKNVFERKEDLLGSKYSYYEAGSRKNLMSGIFDLSGTESTNGTVLLGFRNPSAVYGVGVTVQVVAIIREPILVNGWTKENRNLLFNNIKTLMVRNGVYKIWNNEQTDQFLTCLLTKYTARYTPEQSGALAEYEINAALKDLGNKCISELNLPNK